MTDILERLEQVSCFPRVVSHEQARQAALNFIDAHFNNPGGKGVLTGIPARPEHDDLLLSDYIKQRQVFEAAQDARIEALEEENRVLSAGSCDVVGGKLGDERGNSFCSLQAKLAKAMEGLERIEAYTRANITGMDHWNIVKETAIIKELQ